MILNKLKKEERNTIKLLNEKITEEVKEKYKYFEKEEGRKDYIE